MEIDTTVDLPKHTALCTICANEEKKALIEEMYVNRRTFREIAGEAEVPVGAVQRHVKAFLT